MLVSWFNVHCFCCFHFSIFQVPNADTPIHEAIHDVVNIVCGNKVDDLRYRDRLALTQTKYRHFNEDHLIDAAMNDLTSFAAKIVCDEMLLSEAESRNPHLYDTSESEFSCKLFKSLRISCRHNEEAS